MRKVGIFLAIWTGIEALVVYFAFLIKSPITIAQLACGVLFCAVSCILIKRKALKTRRRDLTFSRSQEDQIKRAREQDAANIIFNNHSNSALLARN